MAGGITRRAVGWPADKNKGIEHGSVPRAERKAGFDALAELANSKPNVMSASQYDECTRCGECLGSDSNP